ncbi:nitrous oxide-stimulated promoter family protein [Hoylesella buccalis]|uniref:Nitrous oxide regulator n=1 Tax=Hoylesella buccalis DNF00853 TaxID=1401074 RepID=A0A095ZNA4_9BACT|nr:nitrous oxide-stimulated promoter family protein [Hoylesella buccalis]KGF35836.1 nitrous oxide regulator [Hoylesella buccalis DNF00853]
MTKIERDQETIRLMIDLYCRHHLRLNEVSEAYRQLGDYACERLQLCKFGEQKPACKDCSVHCYKPDMRQQIREVMRRAGPRMVFYALLATCRHLIQILCFSFKAGSIN